MDFFLNPTFISFSSSFFFFFFFRAFDFFFDFFLNDKAQMEEYLLYIYIYEESGQQKRNRTEFLLLTNR